MIKIKRLSQNATIPTYGSEGAIGMDLYASEFAVIPAKRYALVKTDISCMIPENTYLRLAPRSGLAYKHGIDVLAGVIDADYRGPIGVVIMNNGAENFTIKKGDRIAQAILENAIRDEIVEVEELDDTERGKNGFGSTG